MRDFWKILSRILVFTNLATATHEVLKDSSNEQLTRIFTEEDLQNVIQENSCNSCNFEGLDTCGLWTYNLCHCKIGYTGKFCEIKVKQCLHCNPQGTRACSAENNFSCACYESYKGEGCWKKSSSGQSYFASHERTCLSCHKDNTLACVHGKCYCKFGHSGRFCQEQGDELSPRLHYLSDIVDSMTTPVMATTLTKSSDDFIENDQVLEDNQEVEELEQLIDETEQKLSQESTNIPAPANDDYQEPEPRQTTAITPNLTDANFRAAQTERSIETICDCSKPELFIANSPKSIIDENKKEENSVTFENYLTNKKQKIKITLKPFDLQTREEVQISYKLLENFSFTASLSDNIALAVSFSVEEAQVKGRIVHDIQGRTDSDQVKDNSNDEEILPTSETKKHWDHGYKKLRRKIDRVDEKFLMESFKTLKTIESKKRRNRNRYSKKADSEDSNLKRSKRRRKMPNKEKMTKVVPKRDEVPAPAVPSNSNGIINNCPSQNNRTDLYDSNEGYCQRWAQKYDPKNGSRDYCQAVYRCFTSEKRYQRMRRKCPKTCQNIRQRFYQSSNSHRIANDNNSNRYITVGRIVCNHIFTLNFENGFYNKPGRADGFRSFLMADEENGFCPGLDKEKKSMNKRRSAKRRRRRRLNKRKRSGLRRRKSLKKRIQMKDSPVDGRKSDVYDHYSPLKVFASDFEK